MERSFRSASTTASTFHSASDLFKTRPGAVLCDQFCLERRISTGGMGTVWVADDLRLERKVAIKFLASWESDGELSEQRFEREAILAGKLRSPHVVQIFARGRSPDGRPFIVMELLNGEDLAKRIAREGAFRPELLLCVLDQTTRALSEAHRQGLVHRDIKPHNIFLVADHGDDAVFVKLLDFGVAKDSHTPFTKLTLTGAFIGTLLYMSPEQLTDPHRVGPSADLWGMAVTTYQMLTGELPFDRSTTLPELLVKICRGELLPATSVHPGLPRAVDAVFQRAFQVDPALRFASIEEFRSALSESLRAPAAPTRPPPSVRYRAAVASAFVLCFALGWFVTRQVLTERRSPHPPTALRPAPAMVAAEVVQAEAAPNPIDLPLGAAEPAVIELPVRRKTVQPIAAPEPAPAQPEHAVLVNYGF